MAKNGIEYQSKDTVFTLLFSEAENLLKLYKDLHPEDKHVTIDDVRIETLKNVIGDDIYNDLVFRVKDRYIILMEARNTWNMNLLIGAFFYAADCVEQYVIEKEMDIYAETSAELPELDLYMVYTKKRGDHPKVISLSEEFFEGEDALDLRMKVIYDGQKGSILGQYITFSKIFDKQIKKYGNMITAMVETISICKNKKVLDEFIKQREIELIEMAIYMRNDTIMISNSGDGLSA